MSNFKLNLPTDIPWERICVTEDMIDPIVCDKRLPAKWQTSLAVFKYKPEDEFQLYPKYDITYLKVTATITGYQPLDKEIQGTINWEGVNVATISGLTDLLNSYNPCHGAILQVVVGPKGDTKNIPLDQYPFFMDFEPKKRELYELATDTKEKQSRSIESLNITKSGGSTQSLEILDVDQGGLGIGSQGSYAGTGGGFNISTPNGQWGTKRLNAEESLSSRSSDVGQEKRETFSFATQISQMYNLLDSYHIGTNRAVFFIQPRPHINEEPSGFVRGPRPVEGIQEFFLVVAQPKAQEDFCVSLRLDTSHLSTIPIMDYDRTKFADTDIASATARVATRNDIPAENIVGAKACFIECWDVHYQCYRTEVRDSVTYTAPNGYRIDKITDLLNDATNGSTDIVTSPDGTSLNINVLATGHICYEGTEVCVDCPDTIQEWAGHARRQVHVNLISTTRTTKIGEQDALLITTRGLCCCSSEHAISDRVPMDEFLVGIKPIPDNLSPSKFNAEDKKQIIRQVNELSNYIKTETIRSLNDPNVKLQKFVDSEYFIKQLEYQVVQTKKGREILSQSIVGDLPKKIICKLEEYFKKQAEHITRQDMLSIRNKDLAKMADLSTEDVQKIKMIALGVEFTSRSNPEGSDDCCSAIKKWFS